MLVYLVTLVVTLIVFGLVLFLLMRVKTPHYRRTKGHFVRLLTLVVTGQATDNDWSVIMDIPVRENPQLEDIRLRCLEIAEETAIGETATGYLFNAKGVAAFNGILDELSALPD